MQTALGGSPAQPCTGRPCDHHCLRVVRLFPADLPASAECEKLETKLVSARGGQLSCTERKEIPLWDFIFFPPLHPKNTKRLSVFNANVGFKSFRFGLTLQKKKKSDRLSDMTQKTFFPLNACCSFVKPKAGALNSGRHLLLLSSLASQCPELAASSLSTTFAFSTGDI